MGVFRKLFGAIRYTSKVGFYLGSLYTFFGWIYHKQITYRLNDTQQCLKVDAQILTKKLLQEFEQIKNAQISMALELNKLFVFYSRIWHFREYEQKCQNIHRNIIQSILKNYEQYGIFKQQKQMQKQIKKNDINPNLLNKVVQVKELNGQLTSLYAQDLFNLIEKQRLMHTGKIIGLTPQQKYKLGLVFTYLQLGDRLIFRSEQRYWAYKWLQSEWKKHEYDNTIFKLIFI